MAGYSKAAKKVISRKMRKMKNEKKPRKQKIAIAINEARRKGLKVPVKPDSMKKKTKKRSTKKRSVSKKKTTKKRVSAPVKKCAKKLGKRGGKATAKIRKRK